MVNKDIFRQKALDQLNSPEQLDLLVRQVSLRGWIALMAFGLIIVSTVLWGIFGSIPTKVSGTGIIMKTAGVASVYSTTSGMIEKLNVKKSDFIKKDDLIAIVSHPDKKLQIQSKLKALEELNAKYKKMQNESNENLQLSLKTIKNSDTEAKNQIKYLNIKLKNLQETLSAQQTVYDKGLITKQTMLQTKDSINQTQNDIQKAKNQIITNKKNSLDKKQGLKEKLRQQKDEVTKATAQLELLKNELVLVSEIRSTHDGKIFGISISVGSVINAGTSIVEVEKVGRDNELQAVVFISAMEGKLVKKDFDANISPSTVKKEEFGFIKAKVDFVDEYPASKEEVMNILNNDELVSIFTKDGPPIIVNAILNKDAKTYSGFQWSSPKGPDIHITAGTMVSVEVTVRKQAPITLVIPILKKSLGLD